MMARCLLPFLRCAHRFMMDPRTREAAIRMSFEARSKTACVDRSGGLQSGTERQLPPSPAAAGLAGPFHPCLSSNTHAPTNNTVQTTRGFGPHSTTDTPAQDTTDPTGPSAPLRRRTRRT